jgi:hypothetical protein
VKREDGGLRASARLADRRRAAAGGRHSHGLGDDGECLNRGINAMQREDGVLRAPAWLADRRGAAAGGRQSRGLGYGGECQNRGINPWQRERAARGAPMPGFSTQLRTLGGGYGWPAAACMISGPTLYDARTRRAGRFGVRRKVAEGAAPRWSGGMAFLPYGGEPHPVCALSASHHTKESSPCASQ